MAHQCWRDGGGEVLLSAILVEIEDGNPCSRKDTRVLSMCGNGHHHKEVTINRSASSTPVPTVWATDRRSRKPLQSWKTRIYLQSWKHGGLTSTLAVLQWLAVTLQKGSARKERWWGVLGRVF